MDYQNKEVSMNEQSFKDNLVLLLDKLATSLRLDRKCDTAIHFELLRDRVEAANDNKSLQPIVDEIMKMAPITQYANFTNKQEIQLTEIQAVAFDLQKKGA